MIDFSLRIVCCGKKYKHLWTLPFLFPTLSSCSHAPRGNTHQGHSSVQHLPALSQDEWLWTRSVRGSVPMLELGYDANFPFPKDTRRRPSLGLSLAGPAPLPRPPAHASLSTWPVQDLGQDENQRRHHSGTSCCDKQTGGPCRT